MVNKKIKLNFGGYFSTPTVTKTDILTGPYIYIITTINKNYKLQLKTSHP